MRVRPPGLILPTLLLVVVLRPAAATEEAAVVVVEFVAFLFDVWGIVLILDSSMTVVSQPFFFEDGFMLRIMASLFELLGPVLLLSPCGVVDV